MRAAVIFVLFLVLHLFGECGAHARVPDRSVSSLTELTIEKQQVKNALPSSGEIITANTALEEQKEVIVSVEDDEEEIVRRTTTPARYFPLLSYLFILRQPCPSLVERLFFYHSLTRADSCKYIEQGVLRI